MFPSETVPLRQTLNPHLPLPPLKANVARLNLAREKNIQSHIKRKIGIPLEQGMDGDDDNDDGTGGR